MNSRSLLLSIFITLTLCACTTIQAPVIEPYQYPSINKAVSAEIGDNLLYEGFMRKTPAIRLNKSITQTTQIVSMFRIKECQAKWPAGVYVYKEDILGSMYFEYLKKIFICPTDGQENCYENYCGFYIPKASDDDLYAVLKAGNGVETDRYKIEPVTYTKEIYSEDYSLFRQTLIYNGCVNDVIRFTYREFARMRPSEDLVGKQSYTQDLIYDLKKSPTIGVKGARIKVLEADNTKIKYIVLNHFDPTK